MDKLREPCLKPSSLKKFVLNFISKTRLYSTRMCTTRTLTVVPVCGGMVLPWGGGGPVLGEVVLSWAGGDLVGEGSDLVGGWGQEMSPPPGPNHLPHDHLIYCMMHLVSPPPSPYLDRVSDTRLWKHNLHSLCYAGGNESSAKFTFKTHYSNGTNPVLSSPMTETALYVKLSI